MVTIYTYLERELPKGNCMKKILSPMNVLLSLVLALFIISAAVVITLNFKTLYYLDIDLLDIPAYSGFSREVIVENYDELIRYNSVFGPKTLNFPSLPMSESGRIHFEEVKVVFNFFEITFFATLLLSAAGIMLQSRKKNTGYLLLAGILTVAIPAVLGALIALNWQRVFVLFHKIVFNNDYWIFDPITDPVIMMLPDAFFMHCAILIIALVILGSVLCLLLYGILRKKRGKHLRNSK